MDSANHEKARTIAEESRSIDLDERERFVLDSCEGNEELLSEVRRLLGADQTVAFDASGGDRTVVDSDQGMRHRSRVPNRIGQFNVRREIGVGGMGAVYEAMQENPKRRVAIKVLRSSMAGEAARKRFEYESQVLARLKHPGIAEVYEAGTYDEGDGPMPYFAMEYIIGRKELDEYAEEKELSVEAKIRLFIEVCDALHHGHQKGVVHRDLKPGNILVDAEGRTRIIDFGVARATDSDVALATMQTEVGQIIGTVEYMSPEQCEGDPDLVDVRSDIYALGVILFEMLTGHRPLDLAGSTIYEAVRVIRDNAPTRMGAIDRSLRGDLETIAGKALEKDPDRRYQSALELKQDLERFLANEPIEARPPSVSYQAKMFAKRHKGTAAGIVIVALVLVTTTAWSLIERGRAEAAAEQARVAEAQATLDRDAAQAAELATAKALEQAEDEQARTVQAMEFLAGMFELANPAKAQGRKLDMPDMLREASEQVAVVFADEPAMAATLHERLGRIQFDLGDMDGAESNLVKALILAERIHGTNALEALGVGVELASVLVEKGRIVEARSRLESLREQTALLGEDARHIDLLARGWLMQLYALELRFEEAEAMANSAVMDARELLGPDHEQTIEYEVHLTHYRGSRLRLAGQMMPEDEPRAYGSIERVEQAMGDRHPVTLGARFAEAAEYFGTPKQPENMSELIEGLLEEFRLVLGDTHPRTMEVMSLVGINHMLNGRYDSAVELLAESYDGYLEIYGAEHPSAQYVATMLGSTLMGLERIEEALPYLRSSARSQEKLWGEQDVRTVTAITNLSIALQSVGRFEEAEPLHRRSLRLHDEIGVGVAGDSKLRMTCAYVESLVKHEQFKRADEIATELLELSRLTDGIETRSRWVYLYEAVRMMVEGGHLEGGNALAMVLAPHLADVLADEPDTVAQRQVGLIGMLLDNGVSELDPAFVALLGSRIDAEDVNPKIRARAMIELARHEVNSGRTHKAIPMIGNAINLLKASDARAVQLAYARLQLAKAAIASGDAKHGREVALELLPEIGPLDGGRPGTTREVIGMLLDLGEDLRDVDLLRMVKVTTRNLSSETDIDRVTFLLDRIPASRLPVVMPWMQEEVDRLESELGSADHRILFGRGRLAAIAGDPVRASRFFALAAEATSDPELKTVYEGLITDRE